MAENSVTFQDVIRMKRDVKVQAQGKISGFSDVLEDSELMVSVIVQKRKTSEG